MRSSAKITTVQCDNRIIDSILKAAGISYRDERGQVRDFHSLRKTFGARLARHGVPLVMAQRPLDRSDPELTASLYADVMPEDKERRYDGC